MAQPGKHDYLRFLDIKQLGKLSGPNGLSGAIIEGFQYLPLKDLHNFDETIQGIVIDKVKIPTNLPQRTEANQIVNSTNVIDVYVCIKLQALIEGFTGSEIEQILAYIENPGEDDLILDLIDREIAYIPANYVTKVYVLPDVNCCITESTEQILPSLNIVPSTQGFGSFITGANTFTTEKTYTIAYQNIQNFIELELLINTDATRIEWQVKKASQTTWTVLTTSTGSLNWSLGEVINGNGYLDFNVRGRFLTTLSNQSFTYTGTFGATDGSLSDTCQAIVTQSDGQMVI
jgi:hypothetical protein